MPRSKPIDLILFGHVPSKKNAYRSHGKRRFKDPVILKQIEKLNQQIKDQVDRIELSNPMIRAQFVVRDFRGDLDNKWTTIQDCLVEMGVLKNDSMAHVRNFNVTGTKGKREHVRIRLVTRGSSNARQ